MKIRLLGTIEAVREDGGVVAVSAAKLRWLLAFLALDADRVRSTSSIVDALWPGAAPKSAANLVQGYVSDLRKLLGADRIVTEPTGYRLAVSRHGVDALQFDEAAAHAIHEGTHGPRLELFEHADRLWGGELFGEPGPGGALTAAQVAIEERRLELSERHAQALLDRGQVAGLVPRLETLVSRHPFRERLWLLLALALYHSGRQADALKRLGEIRRLLRDELGVEPGPELEDVEAQILNHHVRPLPTDDDPMHTDQSLVGRRSEISRLVDRWQRSVGGQQQAVFIGGEPGIGKSSLAQVLATMAGREQAATLVGRCDEHLTVPYRPFIEAVTGYLRGRSPEEVEALISPRFDDVIGALPPLAPLVGREPERDRRGMDLLERFETFHWLLQRLQNDRPLLLVLEDLHWSDSVSLRLLHYLVSGRRMPSALILATYRTTEPADLLGDVLVDLRSAPDVERLDLGGLSPDQLSELAPEVEDRDDLAVWVHDQTDGNPFLAIELLDHVARGGTREGVPEVVSEVVASRLRQLPDECQPAMRYAAVLGDTISLRVLRTVVDEQPRLATALAELTARGVLKESTDDALYTFRHAIIRSAIMAMMTRAELEDLHLEAARAWESHPAADDAVLQAATHYFSAGTAAPTEPAIDAFERAGTEADTSGAKVEAVLWYDRALKLLAPDNPRHRRVRLTRFVAAQGAWHWHYGDHLRTKN